MKKQALIIDKRKELSTKYKKIIEGLDCSVTIANKLNEAFETIQKTEPDLVIVSDSIEEPLADFCKKIRILTYNSRPIIIAMSKSAETEDRIKALENGADDFLSEPINSEEFKMRIMAHLRREFELNINFKTNLPTKTYSLKALKRAVAKEDKWACLYISIQNFDFYKELYSTLASDKLIQTYCAIITSTIDEKDYFGHISDNEFLIITTPFYAEKIASFLTFAFDSVSKKFYSENDAKRGYTILQGDEKAGRRSEFVYTTIGIVTNEFKQYKDSVDVCNALIQTHNLAKTGYSNYAIDRPQLSGNDSIQEKTFNNKVWILEDDQALSYLLTTTMELQGYQVEALNNTQTISTLASSNISFETTPAVIIIDAGDIETLLGLDICKCLKQDNRFSNTKIIVTSILHDKELVLNTGADLYLPKPYDLLTLVQWINSFIKEVNN